MATGPTTTGGTGGGGGCPGGCAPITLASGQTNPYGIAVDGTSVYWSTNAAGGGVFRANKLDGSSPSTLADNQNGPGIIAIADSKVFFPSWTDGNIKWCPTFVGCPNGDGFVLVTGETHASEVFVDSTSIYWINANESPGSVGRTDPAGMTKVYIGAGDNLGNVVASESFAFFGSSDGTLVQVDKQSGANPVTVYTRSGANVRVGVDVDDVYVYWASYTNATDTELWRCEAMYCEESMQPLSMNLGNPGWFAFDATRIYWTIATADGAVESMPKDGGSTTTMASRLKVPAGIAVDDDSVFVAESGGGRILRIPK